MNAVQVVVDRILHESGRKDKNFAAGIEAAEVWKCLASGNPMLSDVNEQPLHLRSINREVYSIFAEAHDYRYIVMKDVDDEFDRWRFTKRQ